ncbi:helix-turn-helix domain-containing protein [Allosalinactinospora lopnorensis]|uniref:helix-turn-helix domain-containing protein n=1 Tax=Allosalinactinospora lopnorensis TaxID=1352348 RepID=UPI0006961F2B|nr:helix-turn-helix transcriptional regulator [Allosalinactinospora lopnorensis]
MPKKKKQPQSFADVLDELCRRPVSRHHGYTNTELAQAVRSIGGDITDGYISHLRKGHRDNPTLQTMEDLAAALDVSPAAFVGGRQDRRGDEQPRASFSAKLRHLFAVVYPVGRGPYTPEEVAAAVSEDGQFGSISPSYIRELLNPPGGALPNPRLKHILGLANHFGLASEGHHVAYFLDEEFAAAVDAELNDFAALRNAGVVEFVTRVAEQAPQWTPQMRQQAVEVITQVLESDDNSWIFPFQKGTSGTEAME